MAFVLRATSFLSHLYLWHFHGSSLVLGNCLLYVLRVDISLENTVHTKPQKHSSACCVLAADILSLVLRCTYTSLFLVKLSDQIQCNLCLYSFIKGSKVGHGCLMNLTVVEKSSNSVVAWTELALKSLPHVLPPHYLVCDALSDFLHTGWSPFPAALCPVSLFE